MAVGASALACTAYMFNRIMKLESEVENKGSDLNKSIFKIQGLQEGNRQVKFEDGDGLSMENRI